MTLRSDNFETNELNLNSYQNSNTDNVEGVEKLEF